jgi:hypothetical protein
MLDLATIRVLMKKDPSLMKAIKAEARRNFTMQITQTSRDVGAGNMDRRGSRADHRGSPDKGVFRKKMAGKILPNDLLTEMSAITETRHTGNTYTPRNETSTTYPRNIPNSSVASGAVSSAGGLQLPVQMNRQRRGSSAF